ncbi:TPA: hypothetical protein ACGUVR_004778, partial [Vibrio vulnificus]
FFTKLGIFMKECGVRYVVERRCKAENEHDLLLGSVPIAAKNPAKVVQKLIKGVERCPECTFHSVFKYQDYNDLIELEKVNEIEGDKFSYPLKIVSLVSLIGVSILMLFNLLTHGLLHAVSALSVSMFSFFIFVTYDAWNCKFLSGMQKANIIINVALLLYACAMLPTEAAILELNQSGVKQTLFESIFHE